MVLLPVYARERDCVAVLKAHSTDFTGGDGGLVVKVTHEGKDPTISNVAGAGACNTVLHGLLDEQASHPGTMLGRFLAPNANPVVLGPASHLASGHVSVWLASGWFLTDNYDLATDAYGEASALNPSDALYCTNAGKLTDVAGNATRVRFMKMVNQVSDLLATRVSPPEATGMFAEKAPILIYQAY